MTAQATSLTREAGVELLIQQAPIPPKQRSHSYDDDIGILWHIDDRVILLDLEPGETQGRWQSWRPSQYPDLTSQIQYLDITNPDSWSDLLEEIQSWIPTPDATGPSQEVKSMTATDSPLTRKAGVDLLIQQSPLAPKQRNHTVEDDIGVEWLIDDRIIQLILEPGETQGRWLSWRDSEYPNIINRFQYLDITDPETWSDLLNEIQRRTPT